MNGILFSVGLVLLFLLGVVDSTGKLAIKLNYYDNVQGTLYDGSCCDSVIENCLRDKCDLTFDICVGKHRDEYDCTYGSQKVIAQPNTNEVEFSDSLDFIITGSLKDPLFVRVNVTDVDSGEGTALVDAFHSVYNTAANFNSSVAEYQSYLITGERKQNPTKMNISLASYCEQNYYGEHCSIRCVPEDFGCSGHYTCGSDGSKLCLAGWTGDNCDEQIPGGEADCSFYKDSMELLPSLWEGSYSCPNEISQTLQMNIPLQQPGDVQVSANLSFGGIILTAGGSFFNHHLTIGGHPSPNDRNITNIILSGDQQLKNLTYMIGEVILKVSKEERKCPFTLNMKKSYFSSCGEGTCVRYGQKKEEFYCCCNQNSHSATTHCDTTTTLSTMPSTTTSTTTTTKETTTEKPTTQKPTTEMVTTQKSTTTSTTITPSPTSQETTTTTPQTTTTPTTTEPATTTSTTTKSTTTTLQTTTQAPETTESTTVTTQQTTVTTQPPTTTTTTLPPSTKTTSTTNRPTAPNSPEQVIQESFFINLLDDEVDNTLSDAIMDAYVEANKDNKEVQKSNMDFPDGIPVHKYIYENRKHRGELLTYVKFNISITGVSTPVKVPNLNDIQAQIRKRYAPNVKVYGDVQRDLYPEGVSFHLDVYGPGPSDDEMAVWERVILDVYKTENKCSMDSAACQLYEVSIKCTDEYMDYEGKEVTRLYVFVFNGILAQPPKDTVPYIQALERHSGIQARFYSGSQDKHDLLWYRHHYDMIVEGSVVQSDLPEFVKRLQRAWYQAQTFYYCTLCNVSIHRTEKFVGENGEELTAIVYFFKVREIFLFPNLDGNLNPHQYLDMNKFMDINGNPYKLYNGTKVYRYRHGYNVLIEGQVDSKDRSLFTAVLKQAWLDYNVTLLTTITPSYLIEEYLSSSGDLVSNIVCFISYDGVDIDARLTPTPSMSWLLQWTVNQSNLGFARAGGQAYQVYTKYSLSQLVLRTNLFSMYFEGYLKIDHWTDIAASLQSAWNFTNFSGKNISIQIIKSNTYRYSIYFKREAVTMLSYTLYVDGELVPPFTVLYSQRTLVYNTSMISLATRFPVYVLKDRLLDRRDQFTLYFTTKINYLDFDGGLRTQLLDVIKRKWHDSHQYTNLNLYIDYQEKVYGTDSLVLWKLVFYLMSENREIHSQFVTSITHQLFQSEEIKGLSGHLYQLYKGQMSSAWLSYKSHFTLTFDRQVSELDWSKVRQTLITEWCRSRFSCGSGQDITITIKEQEQYWNEVTRQWYWQLVYFVHHKNQLISSSSHTSIQTSKLDFSWTNVYNGTYTLTLASGGLGWRFSKSFYLWTEEHLTVSAESRDKIGVALLQAWFKMNVRSDLKTCNCISIHVLPQQRYYAGNGKSLWKLTYFISYKNKVVMDAHSWPSLTTSLIDWSIVTSSGVKVRTDIDLYYYMYMMKFSLNHKLSVSEYGKVAKALTQEYILKHPGCGCGVSISHQEEVIDSQGKSSWIVYYHLVKNGTYQKPSSYSPINWTLFNSKHHFTTVDGHELDFAWSWYGKQHYIGYSQSGSLFLQTWVPPSLYGRFAGWLKWYYERFYKGSTVEVEMTNTTREYKQKDGSSAWHLPFILKVNGSLITPPSINSTTFETTFNATSQWKQKFTLVHTDEVTDGNKVFSVHFNHKVSEPAKEEIKKAIIATFVQQHPGVNSSLVNLTFGSQQEIFSSSKNQTTETTGKSSSWELSYTISIGGSEVDTRETTTLNTSLLTSKLNVTGPNEVKYKVITNTESGAFISARRVSSLYVTSFVSVEDVKKMEKSIALAWKKQYNSSEEVKVTFLRQKQYINSKGEVVWKWDYTLSLNSSHLVRAEIPPVNHAHLQVAISNLVSVRKYQLVQSTVSFLDYQMHFPLYLTTKMAKEDKKEFKAKLEQAWAKEGLGAVSVQIVNQEEIIHKTTGQSSWKLVYFLKHNMTDNVIDSRVTENINASHLYHVVGPRGVYRYITHLDSSQYLSKSMSKSIVINTKLDIKGKTRIQHEVAELLKENITDSVLKSSVSVEIAGQEEYFTTQNERAWRILYFIRLGGVYVPASSLLDVDQTRLAARLYNFTTTNTQKFRILKESDLLYSYRNAFSVYFTSKVAASHFYSIQQLLLETWKKAKVYQQCNCLVIHEIVEHHQEEVINSNGVSYWKLNYFIRNNGTVVEAMTHQPLELGEFSTVLSSVNNVKGKSYKVKAITETVVRSRMMFSFHMTSEIGYTHKDKFQTSLKAAWSRQQPNIFKDGEVSIKIFRNTRYVDVVKRTAVWRVDYVIEKSGLRIDPLEIPPLPARELQQNLTFTDPKGAPYQLVDQLTSLLDYRIHFALFVSAEVKSSDFIHFGSALAQYWSSKDFTNGSATVSFQERYVNMYGKMLWKLVVFMKNGSDYLDSRTSEEVNTTEIENSVTFTNSLRKKYQLVNVQSNTLRRYEAGFSLCLSHTVLRSDLSHMSSALRETWTKTDTTLNNVSVEVVSQEKYYSKIGLTNKILYFLSVDGLWVDSGMLGNMNLTILQQNLLSLSTTNKYELVVVENEDLYKYEWLFTIDLLMPLLSVDYSQMKYQLAEAWMINKSTNFKNLTVRILDQENLISGKGVPVYRVLYALIGNSKMQRATQRDPLEERARNEKVKLVKYGTGISYVSRIYSGGDLYRYTDLYSLHFQHRVADYSLLEGQLKEAWNTTVDVEGEKIQKVTIVGQEKILLNTGESAFRLLYHVTSRHEDYTINRPLITGPSHDALIKHVKVEDLKGATRKVLNVTEGFRMSQVFSVVVNRRVYMSDQSKFESSLLLSLQNHWTDVSSAISFTVRSTERVVDKHSRQMLWRYSYVITMNGHPLDVSRHAEVRSETLTSSLNFTSPSNINYVAVDAQVGSYEEMFSLQVENIQNTKKSREILGELSRIWSKHSVSGIVIGELLREEYLSSEGLPLTKFSYFVNSTGGSPVYPSVTRPPSYVTSTSALGLRLFTGQSSLRYTDCFRLYVSLPLWTVDRTSVQTALTQVWQQQSPATKNITIRIVNGMDSFVGKFGLQLSAFLYTISYQSSGQTKVITPDMTIHPESQKVQSALSTQNSRLTVYLSSPVRTRSLFHVSLRFLKNVTMTISTVQSVSSKLKEAWSSLYMLSKVETQVVSTKEYRTISGRSQVTRLYYHVQINNKTTEPWEDRVHPAKLEEILAKLVQNDSSLRDRFVVNNQSETQVYTLFIEGHQRELSDVQTAIKSSWQDIITSGSVVVNTHGAQRYVSDDWKDVTKLAYTVTINGSSPEALEISPPSFERVEASLKKVSKAQCPCYAKKARKEYLLGTKTSLDVAKVQEALKSVWTQKNQGIRGQKFTVKIKDVKSRQKRGTESAPIQTKLVGKNNKEITPVQYMVALEGHDPDPSFVATPSSNDLAQPLTQAGAAPCGCTPKLAGSFQLKGNTNPNDKGKITDAIADAFANENQDVNKNNIIAEAKLNNTKSNGDDVTVVDYTIQRSDDEAVETLKSPKRVDLERSLSTVGKTLYSRAPVPPPKEEDKKLAIYIAVAVVAFIILVLIICYIVYLRRRRKMGNLLKREQTVKEKNFFDSEHFSEPAASHTYKNPNFEPDPAMKEDLRNV